METVPNTFPSLFWGYTVIWVLVVAYVWTLGQRLKKLEARQPEEKKPE